MESQAALARPMSSSQSAIGGMIGQSLSMRRLYELIAKVRQNNSPVLLIGETGTGKELVARCIHSTGLRQGKPFVPVDCSALTSSLIESELFGHCKGAFTGADRFERGLLQAANEGTVFLDEIGEIPTPSQAKLLRAIQEREVRPVGSTAFIPVDIRFIAATNRDLGAQVQAGAFREDLFYRLNVVQIRLPALRERKSDIPLLVAHFLRKFSDFADGARTISDEAMARLVAYDWPGNVREMQNAVQRAVVLSSDRHLGADDFAFVATGDSKLGCGQEIVSLAELERRAVVQAVREAGGNRIAAARLLGIGKTTLYRKLKEYALTDGC
jgi:DNA-binding NtrC family response regulator